MTYDQFSQGYLSIKKAVEAIHAGRQKQETLLDLVYLDQQELPLVYMRKCSILWNRGK